MAAAPAPKSPSWTLVGRLDGAGPEPRVLHTRRVLAAVLRRGLPNLIEATLVPTVLFLAVGAAWGPGAAMAAVLVWGFGAIGRRLVLRRRIPALLALATVVLTVRTVVGLASGSTFFYFVQPVATTVALAAITVSAIALTVVMALRTAQREHLVFQEA